MTARSYPVGRPRAALQPRVVAWAGPPKIIVRHRSQRLSGSTLHFIHTHVLNVWLIGTPKQAKETPDIQYLTIT